MFTWSVGLATLDPQATNGGVVINETKDRPAWRNHLPGALCNTDNESNQRAGNSLHFNCQLTQQRGMVHRCSNYVGHMSSALTAGWKVSGGGGGGESFVKHGVKFIFAHSFFFLRKCIFSGCAMSTSRRFHHTIVPNGNCLASAKRSHCRYAAQAGHGWIISYHLISCFILQGYDSVYFEFENCHMNSVSSKCALFWWKSLIWTVLLNSL